MFATLLAPLQSIQEMATDDRFNDMVKFFAIAVVLVTPACVIVWRRAAAKHAAEAAALAGETDEVEEIPADPNDLKTVIAEIDAAARSLTAGESATVSVPERLTLDGSAAPAMLVDTLIGDAITRNRCQATWADDADGRIATLTKA